MDWNPGNNTSLKYDATEVSLHASNGGSVKYPCSRNKQSGSSDINSYACESGVSYSSGGSEFECLPSSSIAVENNKTVVFHNLIAAIPDDQDDGGADKATVSPNPCQIPPFHLSFPFL